MATDKGYTDGWHVSMELRAFPGRRFVIFDGVSQEQAQRQFEYSYSMILDVTTGTDVEAVYLCQGQKTVRIMQRPESHTL